MEAGVRLAAYGAGLVVAFGASYGIAGAAVPDEVVARWSEPEPSHVDTHADAPPHEAADAA
ncbi:MAG TPA: heavy metal-binding domain-containing protein, partial [Janibacter terrae]|nr:heavy metal-binding domain-containing protein [Janibacter terrae]